MPGTLPMSHGENLYLRIIIIIIIIIVDYVLN
jgi:hypothetical protein